MSARSATIAVTSAPHAHPVAPQRRGRCRQRPSCRLAKASDARLRRVHSGRRRLLRTAGAGITGRAPPATLHRGALLPLKPTTALQDACSWRERGVESRGRRSVPPQTASAALGGRRSRTPSSGALPPCLSPAQALPLARPSGGEVVVSSGLSPRGEQPQRWRPWYPFSASVKEGAALVAPRGALHFARAGCTVFAPASRGDDSRAPVSPSGGRRVPPPPEAGGTGAPAPSCLTPPSACAPEPPSPRRRRDHCRRCRSGA